MGTVDSTTRDPLKQRLATNEATVGSWVTLGHPSIAEIMARAGFDWLVIDAEHSVLDYGDIQRLIQVIEPHGVAPLVRLTSNHPDQIKRVMDAGAHGIMVPMVCDAGDAEKAVAAMHYPPRGNRGVGLARAQGYGHSFQAYRQWLDEQGIVVVMIEHASAVEQVEAILATPGVDAYIIGPYDLSGSLGVPGELDHPEVTDAIERIRQAGEAAGKPGGLHVVEPDLKLYSRHARSGFRFLGYGLDIRILDSVCRQHLAIIRGE